MLSELDFDGGEEDFLQDVIKFDTKEDAEKFIDEHEMWALEVKQIASNAPQLVGY